MVAVACRSFGFTFLVWHFSAPATVPLFVSRGIALYVCSLFTLCEDLCCCYIAPCTVHRGWGFVGVWRGPLCLAFGSSPLGGYNRISGRASPGVLKCTVQCVVESTENPSWVSVCCVVSGLKRLCKVLTAGILDGFPVFRDKWTMYYTVDSCQLSVFWGFASCFRLWLLWSLHCRRRWPSPWY